MLLVEDTEDGASPSKRTLATMEQGPEPSNWPVAETGRSASYGTAEVTSDSLASGPMGTCRNLKGGALYVGSGSMLCAHCTSARR